jgi:hypothetical protein
MKISVITPSVRKDGLEMVRKTLRRQDFDDYEWIVVSPFEYNGCDVWLKDPPMRAGDFWNLCKAWNKAYANARGELVVNIQDLIWTPPDTLSRFWEHYLAAPKTLVTAVGHQYCDTDPNGKPINLVWTDPRVNPDRGSFFEVDPNQMEMAVCSIPTKALWDCGGIDEEYDTGPGVQEKEMCFRLKELGYKFFQDQSIEYRAFQHGRLTPDWDEKYFGVTAPLFTKHVRQLLNGERTLNVHCLEKYNDLYG